MPKTLILVPINVGVGLTTVSLGLVRAFENQGIRVSFMKPVTQRHDTKRELAVGLLSQTSPIQPPKPIIVERVEKMLSDDRGDDLLEEIVSMHDKISQDVDIVVVQGLVTTQKYPYAYRLNVDICKALGAQVIFVASPGNTSISTLADQIEIAAAPYGKVHNKRILGCIFNKINAPTDEQGNARLDLAYQPTSEENKKSVAALKRSKIFHKNNFQLIGAVSWDTSLIAPRVKDVAELLDAKILNEGEINERRIMGITLCARSVANIIDGLKAGSLIITASDRSDIIIATALAALNGIKIAALFLTGDYSLDDKVKRFCDQAIKTGLPIIAVKNDSYRTAIQLQNLNLNVPLDDIERIEAVKNHVADSINKKWISTLIEKEFEKQMSPSAFRYLLTEKARKAKKRIVLPEGEEPRTIEAATICANRGIAHCVLLGNKKEIQRVAKHQGILIPTENFEIISPKKIRNKFVKPLVKLREHKAMTKLIAKEQLEDNVVLGTMMLAEGEVDGLVSGAIHTTANTIRPALQLIKTPKGVKIVSSIFFMCMPEQVLVYGDCAVNPNPNAEELADIAIQSADSAKAFEITPRVAMISYSTGKSGQGSEVEKVTKATEIVKEKRPDIIIDGPLQYDAALIEKVAKKKAPNSPVAGQATVCIFPDLNTGNTTYKAVQRSADVLCIGPMLQGLKKPVNDLSRGATVDDIVYTIAITAIQS